jgi:hypothetical protein
MKSRYRSRLFAMDDNYDLDHTLKIIYPLITGAFPSYIAP